MVSPRGAGCFVGSGAALNTLTSRELQRMNTALYCTSTAPTDTYYTHTRFTASSVLKDTSKPITSPGVAVPR